LLFFSYVVLFRQKSSTDILYLFLSIALVLHWVLLNGECVLSYWDKLETNPYYVAGSDISNLQDILHMGISIHTLHNIYTIFFFVWTASIFVTFVRNDVPGSLVAFFFFFFILFILSVRLLPNNYLDSRFRFIQVICTIGLLISTLWLYSWWTRRRRLP
jgi:hypothetical protein